MPKPRPLPSRAELVEYGVSYDPRTGILYCEHKGRTGTTRTGKMRTYLDVSGYLKVYYRRKMWFAHRLAFVLMGRDLPELVDHKNGVRTDNRWRNLRPATYAQNSHNRVSRKGKYRGTFRAGNKWAAYIKMTGKTVNLGSFETREEARAAYRGAAKIIHKGFLSDAHSRVV